MTCDGETEYMDISIFREINSNFENYILLHSIENDQIDATFNSANLLAEGMEIK